MSLRRDINMMNCQSCRFVARNPQEMQFHVSHNHALPFPCQSCPFRSFDRREVQYHVDHVHRGQFRGPARGPVREPVRGPYREPVREPYREPVRGPVREQVREPYREPVRAPVPEDDTKATCKKCGLKVDYDKISEHLKKAHPILMTCKKCGEKVPGDKMTEHLKDVHPIMDTCRHCGKEIKKSEMIDHLVAEHPEPAFSEADLVYEDSDESDYEEEEMYGNDISKETMDNHFFEQVKLRLFTGFQQAVESEHDKSMAVLDIKRLCRSYLSKRPAVLEKAAKKKAEEEEKKKAEEAEKKAEEEAKKDELSDVFDAMKIE